MKPLFALTAFLALLLPCPAAEPPASYLAQKTEAEKFIAEKSFAKAHEIYRIVNVTNLPPAEQRWVLFRRADTLWRSEASTQRADNTKFNNARQELNVLVRDVQREEEKDRVWVEVQESLGDSYWAPRNQRNWSGAWQHYSQALDWWAGQRASDESRNRYLSIVWRSAKPPQAEPYYRYGNYGNVVPLNILENTLKIAVTENDKAHAHYLLAISFNHHGGDWDARARVPEHFEAALKPGKGTDWYDDALYFYAEWMMNQGRAVPLKDGNWTQEQDYVKALALFRRLVAEFNKGETRYWEQAQAQIRNITQVNLGVGVAHIFLPDSEVQYHLNWRNLKRVDLALYPVDLTKDVNLGTMDGNRRPSWLQTIDLAGREKVKTWEHDTKDKGEHRPGNAQLRVDGKLRPGAYVLEAQGGGQSVRDLVLVTDAALVLKTSGKTALVFVTDALSGKPLANAKARLWERWHVGNNKWEARSQDKVTDKDGLAVFEVTRQVNNNVEIFAAATAGDKQAFSPGNTYSYRDPHESWRIYAFTDRPAYRPKEKVEWKAVVRRYNGSVYSTPANETIAYSITGPDGAKVKEGDLKLNEFGTGWASLELTEQQRLGEYRVQFRDKAGNTHIGNATLFRLEEYKLPEFKVVVQTPEEDVVASGAGVPPAGSPATVPVAAKRKKAFRTGDKVEVNVQADYYFGGPVANATVEVIVHQNPYYFAWKEPREFGWFYEENEGRFGRGRMWRGGGGGQILKRETLKTDATGKATLEFESPKDYGQDFEFRIEARVVDASRREITGSGTVRVTRQRYYIHAKPEHNLHKPGDKATVNFRAQDANEQPAQIEGIVKVTREYWEEIWVNPAGKEVKGPELKALQSDGKFPPAPQVGQRPWRLKFRGYHSDDILTRTLKTDTEGKVDLVFTPEREGYYKVTWLTEDAFPNRPPQPIRTETTLWVANNATAELGYRHGGVEIIVDRDTFRSGQKAPVMLVANSNDRYVLFTVEADELISHQVVHLTGTVKLVELALSDAHVPNVFLSAAMVADKQVHMDTKQVIVPPTKHFLTVDVKPDRAQYQPREDGTLLVTARDHDGKPVAAEVAVGLVDESVYYIQSDYAGDPRQFYYGTKRQQRTQTQSTFNQKRYTKLVEWEEDGVKMVLEQEEAKGRAFRKRQWSEEGLGDQRELQELRKSNEVMETASSYANGMNNYRARGLPMAMSAPAAPAGAAAMDAMTLDAAPARMLSAKSSRRDEAGNRDKQAAGEDDTGPNVVVRSDFRSTIIWLPDVKTGADGTARVPVKYPDSLTGWKATARAVGSGAQFGIANTTTRTKQPLIVRLQAPRFFVVGDEVVLSAVVNNNTEAELSVKVTLEASGNLAVGRAVASGPNQVTLKVAPNSEARADWKARVVTPGEVRLKTTAVGGKFSDAMEKAYLSHEHGIERFLTKAGKVRGSDITVRLDIPAARKKDTTTLVVQVAPSLAVTMLDALPYLIDYPYGCTEQTMSRFLPSVVTAKTLKDLGLQPEDVMSRVFGGIEARAGGLQPPNLGAKKDLSKLNEMTDAGLKRLYDFQHADGGWGWWKEGQSDRWMTAYVVWGLTLAKQSGVALKPNVLERGTAFLNKTLVEEELNHDMQAFMLHATVADSNPLAKAVFSPAQNKAWDNLWTNREGLNAYTRALLALAAHHMGKGVEARTLIGNLENGVKRDERPDASVLIGGQLPANAGVMGTAHWGEDGIYWRWSDGGVEATAFALRALLAIDPQNKLIEPVTNWLLKGRRGAQWSNTRDTAITVLALNDYLRVTKELAPELEYEVTVNGTSIAKRKVSGAEVFAAPSRFAVDPKLIKDGANDIRIRRKGEGPVYFAAEARFFSLEEPIPASGNEIFVKREYFKLVGRPTLLKGLVYDKVPLLDGETVTSGERIETVLTIEAKNNYEYLLFEDLKPAGFEAVAVRSGESLHARELKSGAVERKFGVVGQPAPAPTPAPSPKSKGTKSKGTKSKVGAAVSAVAADVVVDEPAIAIAPGAPVARMAAVRPPIGIMPPRPIGIGEPDFTGRTRWVYQELRDRKVALFLDKLPEGVWQLRYEMRAEVPGAFHALPVLGHAMYVPEVRCNGAEIRVKVVDTK